MKKLLVIVFALLVILIVAVPLIFGQVDNVIELPVGENVLICANGGRPAILIDGWWESTPYVMAACFAVADFLPLLSGN